MNTVASEYKYPKTYGGWRPLSEQIDLIEKIFSIEGDTTKTFINGLPSQLPKRAEGWFVFPKMLVLGTIYFPDILDSRILYLRLLELAFKKLSEFRPVKYDLKRWIDFFGRTNKTLEALQLFESQQVEGDMLIIPAQTGFVYRGQPVEQVERNYNKNEFGLGLFEAICLCMTHPERFNQGAELDVDCPGDIYRRLPPGNSRSPFFMVNGEHKKVCVSSREVSKPVLYCGSFTGFTLP